MMQVYVNRIGELLQKGTLVAIGLLVLLLPIFFLPFTVDPFELNKQMLLLVFVCLAALFWIGSQLAGSKSLRRRGWIFVGPLLLFSSFFISAIFSSSTFLSFIGGGTQEYTSVFSVAGLCVLFYLIADPLSEQRTQRWIQICLLIGALLVGLLSAGNILFLEEPFSTIGTFNATGIFLIAISLWNLGDWVFQHHHKWLRIGTLLLSLLTIFYLIIIDYWLLWFFFVVGILLLFGLALLRANDVSVKRFIIPTILFIISLLFWIWLPTPFTGSVPSEVTLSHQASWDIAQSGLRHNSFYFGSGPGTYAFVYEKEHSAAVNQTDFFNTRFDRAASFILTLLPTVGTIGTGLFSVFFLAIAGFGLLFLVRKRHQKVWMVGYTVWPPFMILFIAAMFYHFNLTLITMLFLFAGLIAGNVFPARKKSVSKQHKVTRLISLPLLCISAFIFFIGIFFVSQRSIAEYAFAKAVRADRQGVAMEQIITWLSRSAMLNQFDDRAQRVLAHALLIFIGELQDDTQTQSTTLSPLVSAALTASRRATELSPLNSANWLTRGVVYRELASMMPEASAFAISAFLKATELSPVSPVNWTELGMTYLTAAEQEQQRTSLEDQAIVSQAEALRQDYLTQAFQSFEKAIELKKNYAPAHYQLGLAYAYQGRLDEAIGKMESVANYNSKDVGVAFELGQLYLRRDKQGDQDRAKVALESAVTLAPSFSNARWFLATVYEQEGNISAAITQIEKVQELNPNNQLVQNRLDRLLKGQLSSVIPKSLDESEKKM